MIFFLSLSLLRVCFVSLLSRTWWRINSGHSKEEINHFLTFSILIPIRNESANILFLLKQLENQDYPRDLFEVIVIDDHSEDNSSDLVNTFIKKTSLRIRLLILKEEKVKGKKMAITKGIEWANNDYILATDGDCDLPPTWISAYARAYQIADPPFMVTGPVRMQSDNMITSVQAMEFSALIGYGASSLSFELPGTCNGANLSYKKTIFKEVHGYAGNENIPSGDDEFLMLKIHRSFKGKVKFLKDKRAIVSTPAKKNLSELINQRIRWSSKWKFHKSNYITASAFLFFADYFLWIAAIVLMISGAWDFKIIVPVVLIRWLVDYLYVYLVSSFLESRRSVIHFLIMQIIYPVFVIFLGIASIFGTYHWKGRAYS